MIQSFNIFHDSRIFTVTYESDSPVRNRLHTVHMDGYSLDICDMRRENTKLYLKIKVMMDEHSDEAWKEEEKIKEEIPTLAYQKSAKDRLVQHIRNTFATVLIMFPLFMFGQKNDTLFVKKVFLNGKLTKIKKGYVVHLEADAWEVNGKVVHLFAYKKTENPDFKPDTSTAKK